MQAKGQSNQICEASLFWNNIVQVYPKLRDHLQSTVGSDQITCQMEKGTAEENPFQAVQMQLTQAPVMTFFKQGAETGVTTDASPVGVGAVLEQKQDDWPVQTSVLN